MSQPGSRTGFDWFGRFVLYAAALGGGWVLADRLVRNQAEHNPAAMAGVLVVLALVCAGVALAQRAAAERNRPKWDGEGSYVDYLNSAPKLPGWAPPAVIVLALAVIVGWVPGTQAHSREITYYCEYGAVSRAQLDHCKSHVSSDYIDSLETNAARFARGDLDACLDDAGPFCDADKFHNDVEPDGP